MLRGAVLEARLPLRSVGTPLSCRLAASGPRMAWMDSNSDRSTTCPLPWFTSTLRSAIMAAEAPYTPDTMSARASGGSTGGRSGKPFMDAKPLAASTSVPKPGLCA